MFETTSAHRNHYAITALIAFLLLFGLGGCIQPESAANREAKPMPEAQTQAKTEQAPSPKEQSLPDSQQTAELQNNDCQKCHDSQPADINSNGAKHKTEIECLSCHIEHLPLGQETIPQCSMCHDSGDNKHFGLENCLMCHRNPHTPLDVTFENDPAYSTGCFTCHGDKEEEFKAHPSMHSKQNCTFCHPQKHKKINKCFTCHPKDEFHGGNGSFMTFEDCLGCHKPHSPRDISYADDTPSKICGTCHVELYELLSNSKAKHSKLNCAYCHKSHHPTVPSCRDCHSDPHASALLSTFRQDCLKCHRSPHDLIF